MNVKIILKHVNSDLFWGGQTFSYTPITGAINTATPFRSGDEIQLQVSTGPLSQSDTL